MAVLLVAWMLCGFVLPLSAQMLPQSRNEGKLGPIVGTEKDSLTVLIDGKRRVAGYHNVEVHPGGTFASGRAEISAINANLDPLRDASPAERAKPDAIRFRYEADVTSAQSIKDCYGILITMNNGSIASSFVKVGRLEPGKARHVKVELGTRVEAVGNLHLFTVGQEIRSNQVPDAYDVAAYCNELCAKSRGVPAIELCKSERMFSHYLSQDGRLLATTRDRDTHQSLIVYDLESMKLLCDAKVGDFSDTISDVTWIANEQVAFICDGKLMLLEVAKGTVTELKKDVQSIIGQDRHNPSTIVLLFGGWFQPTWTASYDLKARKSSDARDLFDGWNYFDDTGEARVRFVYEGAVRKVYYKPKPGARWKPLDEDVKQDGLRFNVRAGEMLDRTVDFHSFGADGDTLYLSTRLGTDRFQLAAFSMSQGKITRAMARHPKYDLNTTDGSLSRLLERKSSAEVIGITYEGQKYQTVWFDPAFAAVQKLVDTQYPGYVNLPLDWSDDASTVIYLSFSDRDPGTYFVIRPKEGKIVPLLSRSERLKNRTLAQTEHITFKSRDGVDIPAYVTRPPEKSTSPAPLIVRIHGGPTARDSWDFDAMNQYLATRGYVVLQVNYRGSSGFGATFQNTGLRSRLDTVIIDDIVDGTRHLIGTGEIDPQRIGVMGASFGGWATYLCLIKHPELYRAGVAESAVAHWRTTLKNDRWFFHRKWAYTFWKSILDRTDFDKEEPFIDPLLRAAELKQPIYVLHGEYDNIVHAKEAKAMIEALQKTNPQVESLSFPWSGHGFGSLSSRVTELNEVGGFFARHLAPEKPAPVAASTAATP